MVIAMADEERQGDEPRDERDEVEADDDQGHEPQRDDEADGSQDDDQVDISDTTAPSIGPNTVIEKDDPEERLARHEQSDTDAMGLDKRREVVGGQYSPSIGRQAAMYGIFLAVTAVLVVGFILLAGKLDQAPDSYPDEAPWSQQSAPQREPAELE
jgi:hypothetical protein